MSKRFVVVRTPKQGEEPEVLERTEEHFWWWSNSPNHPKFFRSTAEAEELLAGNDYFDHPEFDVVIFPFEELRIIRLGGSNVLLPVR